MPRAGRIVIATVTILGMATGVYLWRRQANKSQQAVAQPAKRTAPARRPPMFSPDYTSALKGVLEIEEPDARKLEQTLESNPTQWPERLRLIAYYARADHANDPKMRNRRVEHYLWLVEHQPYVEVLRSPYGHVEPGSLSGVQEGQARRLWQRVLESSPSADVLWNAAQFFAPRDAAEGMRLAQLAVKADPANWQYGQGFGQLYAARIAEAMRSGNQQKASDLLREAEATNNAAVLEPIVWVLQREYIGSVMLGQERPVFHETAERLFAQVLKLNPQVDREWVMPQVKPEMRGMLNRPPQPVNTAQLTRRIRRLAPSAFPDLPSGILAVLHARGCTVPQPGPDDKRNVIRGAFFAPEEQGWAVVCSSRGKSSILAFRNDADDNPEVIAGSEDATYVGGTESGPVWYQREIRAVGRDFIMTHYRAYGGVKPPPIRHQAIDDSFLEKASVVWYRHEGKWLQLQGAD